MRARHPPGTIDEREASRTDVGNVRDPVREASLKRALSRVDQKREVLVRPGAFGVRDERSFKISVTELDQHYLILRRRFRGRGVRPSLDCCRSVGRGRLT